tara:strand:+ start:701 stop:1306 length:606 start_codon:yes stop_codon:yes gene_type:complete
MTTITLDTELSAVNSILASIGQAPVASLDFTNPEIAIIHGLLREVNIDVQSEGWSFNTEEHVKYIPDSNGHFVIPINVIRYDVTDGQSNRNTDVVTRNGKLYDKVKHTYIFEGELYLDLVTLYEFNDLPAVFKRYIIHRAAGRAATQLVVNPEVVQLLASQEAQARASCIDFECDQGDHSFMGWEAGSTYHAFQPSNALRR